MTSGWLELQSWHCKQTGSSGCVHGGGTEAGWETCWGGPMLQLLLFQSLASISCAEMSSKGQQAALACTSCTKSRKEQERTNQKTQSKERAKCWEEKHSGSQRTSKAHTKHAITCCRKGSRIISFHAMHRSLQKMRPFCHSILFQRLSFMLVALLSLMTLILSTQVSSVHMQRRDTTEEQNSLCASEKPAFLSSH